MPPTLGTEHGVRTNDVEISRQEFEEEVFGEFLDGENVDEQCAALQALKGERKKHFLGGDYGGTEENDFWVFLEEVVGVGEEGDAQFASGEGVVGAGVGEDGVALAEEGGGEELAEVAEADDGDLELLGVVELEGEFGLVVEVLSCIDGANAKGFGEGKMMIGVDGGK